MLSELPYMLMRALEAHDDLDGLGYDLLVVDEYQDLNACDLRVLHLIADRGVMLMALGDDEQSIYSFRRAHPEGIRRFPHEYPAAADYPLTVSHRCGHAILAWACHVVEASADRQPGRISVRPAPTAPEGDAPPAQKPRSRVHEKTPAALGSTRRRSHSSAVSPSTTMRVRLGASASGRSVR